MSIKRFLSFDVRTVQCVLNDKPISRHPEAAHRIVVLHVRCGIFGIPVIIHPDMVPNEFCFL